MLKARMTAEQIQLREGLEPTLVANEIARAVALGEGLPETLPLESHVRPTRTQSGSSRAHRDASTPPSSAAPRRSERASSLAATSCPPPSNWRRGEPQDDVPVALAGPAHGPQRDLPPPPALAPIALHRPLCRALGQRRGDGVIGPVIRGSLPRSPPEMEFLVARAIRSGPGRPSPVRAFRQTGQDTPHMRRTSGTR